MQKVREQRKRLSENIKQAEQNKKDRKKSKTKSKNNIHQKSSHPGGFFDAFMKKIFGRSDIPLSAQDSIPYLEMCRDGICQVSEGYYTKTIQYGDINYHLARSEEQTAIFENYCDILNYFDSTVDVQISSINTYQNREEVSKSIDIPKKGDGFDDLREEYSNVLKSQQAKGNNGLMKSKYITFGIHGEEKKAAKLRIERLEADVINNYKSLGVYARSLSGIERLEVMHGLLHPDGKENFYFRWADIPKTGMSTKDFIAPTSFHFDRNGKLFQMGGYYGAVGFLQILAPELEDRILKDFLDMDTATVVTIHIKSIDQTEAIKLIKHKLSDVDKMKIEEQKKAVRAGYDMDIIPSDLATYGNEAKSLLENLQSRNERMFLVTVLIMNAARTKQKLETDIFAAASIAQKHNCALKRLDYQQEQGLMSSLPLGLNQIEITRGLTTSSVAIFVPFTTCELYQAEREAMYYGVNALSNNLIMACRKLLKNPNGLLLGSPGSGKSFAAKREIVNVFFLTEDDIIITDPEAEYSVLVQRLGGQVIKLDPISTQYINPMDINPDYADEEDPLTLKSDFILSLCELILGGKAGLEPSERTIIDRCVRLVYQKFMCDPKPEHMPILGDLYQLILQQPEEEAHRIAIALEMYVTGSLRVFNHHTNVDITNRLVCYDIKTLGKSLKKIAMLILQDSIWNRVTTNRAAKKTTWVYIDEMHLLLKEEQTAAYTVEIWKRFRKWGGIPTGLTQNIKDFLASKEIENIFDNSDFIMLLNQGSGDRKILAAQLSISPSQLSYVTDSNAGEGLLKYGNIIVPFVDRFPQDTEIYSLLTTKPSEMKES